MKNNIDKAHLLILIAFLIILIAAFNTSCKSVQKTQSSSTVNEYLTVEDSSSVKTFTVTSCDFITSSADSREWLTKAVGGTIAVINEPWAIPANIKANVVTTKTLTWKK